MPAYPVPKPKPLDEPSLDRSPAEARLRGFGQGAMDAIKGLMGGDDPSSQLMGTVAPLGMAVAPKRVIGETPGRWLHPAVNALLQHIDYGIKPPEVIKDPLQVLASESRYLIPKPGFIRPPEGFTLPESGDFRMMKRPYGMASHYDVQRRSLAAFKPSTEEKVTRTLASSTVPRVHSLDELRDVAPSAQKSPVKPSPPLSGKWGPKNRKVDKIP